MLRPPVASALGPLGRRHEGLSWGTSAVARDPTSHAAVAPVSLAVAAAAMAAAALRRRRQPRVRCRVRLDGSVDQIKVKPKYGEATYWDQRYEKEAAEGQQTYDWLGDYARFKEFIEAATGGRRDAKLLDLGCGNARLTEELFDDGFKDITGLDISPVVIEQMSKRNAETRPGIKWVVGDCFNMDLPDESFDLVIDKSTMDAVSCSPENMNTNMVRMTAEVSRVLRTGGTYIVFSACSGIVPSVVKLPHLSFQVEHTNIPMPFSQLDVYACRKKDDANSKLLITLDGTLATAEQIDRNNAESKRRREEAEERLKQDAPSSFDLLD